MNEFHRAAYAPVITTAVFAFLLVPAGAQAPPPVAPASPPAAPTATPRHELLRLKFPVGQTLYYRLTEDTVGSYKEPQGRLTPIKSHLEMHQHQTVTDRRDDSAGLVDVGIDSMTVTVDGKPSPSSDDTAAGQANAANLVVMAHLARLIVLPNGKLEATVVNPALDADEVLLGEDPAHMNALSGLGIFPEMTVQVGDKWKSLVLTGLIGEQSSANLVLTAWETKDAASIAVISQKIRGTFGSPPGDAAHPAGDMKIKGWISGTRTVRLNVEAGTVESTDSVVLMTVLLTPKDADDKFSGPPTQMWVKETSALTRTAAPPAASTPVGSPSVSKPALAP